LSYCCYNNDDGGGDDDEDKKINRTILNNKPDIIICDNKPHNRNSAYVECASKQI